MKNIWGPACWTTLHVSAAALDKERLPSFVKLISFLSDTLPCPECRSHVEAYFKKFPPESIETVYQASKYCFDLHNHVNSITRKPLLNVRVYERLYGVKLQSLPPPGIKVNLQASQSNLSKIPARSLHLENFRRP